MTSSCATAIVAAMVVWSGLTPDSTQQLSTAAALDLYQAGERRRAIEGLDARVSGFQFTRDLSAWIRSAESAREPHRRFVAAAFALEAVWATTRSTAISIVVLPPNSARPLSSRQSMGVVAAWAARETPMAGAASAAERALWLSMIGIAEDAQAWRALQTDILPAARRRLPDEPRVRLAAVLALVNIDLGPMRRYWIENLNASKLREEDLPSSVISRIPAAIRSFDALLTETSLGGEIDLRAGYLELRRRSWTEALRRFEAARTETADPLLQATADYLGGWVLEQRGDGERAIAAYRRALMLVPTMRNLATRLSALLFLRDERAEAFTILDRAVNARPVPIDLLESLERGDSRFVPTWLETVRLGLPPASGS